MVSGDTMLVEGDSTATGTFSADDRAGGAAEVAPAARRSPHANVLEPKEVTRAFIRDQPSDIEGFKQLAFHIGSAVLVGMWISRSLSTGATVQLVLGELLLGLISSFYFAGFHEMIHGTAFRTRGLNKLFSHLAGFAIFRGANWYYYFHWHHHRFTNDPERDPELSGTTMDRADPTAASTLASKLTTFALFLSGYPFGFERLPGIYFHAIGCPSPESWVDQPKKARQVQLEYMAFMAGYAGLGVAALLQPTTVGAALWWYWLLPHMLGAGHLRYYQTAEHRACKMGGFTDTNAWMVSRTTATWWIYRKLAWNMPFHQEHHAWPNVPFYLLPALHARVVDAGTRPPSDCSPTGTRGYFWMHLELLKQLLSEDKQS